MKLFIIGADIKTTNNTFSSKEFLLAANERQLKKSQSSEVWVHLERRPRRKQSSNTTHTIFHLAVRAGVVTAVNLHGYPSPPSQLHPTLEERPLPSLKLLQPRIASFIFRNRRLQLRQAECVCALGGKERRAFSNLEISARQRKRHVHEETSAI